jgi:hypothetical protein
MRRPSILKPLAWNFALWFFCLTPASLRAHGLEADYRILPGRKVQVECWFSRTLSPRQEFPARAEVKVFRPGEEVLATGQLDEKGTFVFAVGKPEKLRVVIADGQGHGKELTIPAEELAQTTGPSGSAPSRSEKIDATAPESTDQVGRHVHNPAREGLGLLLKDALVGVSFLLAAAAFFLSLRNTRALRRLQVSSASPPHSLG